MQTGMPNISILQAVTIKTIFLSAIILGLVIITLIVDVPRTTALRLASFSPFTKVPGSCPPRAYARGSWKAKNVRVGMEAITEIKKQNDVFRSTGFDGCASSREFWWHIAADKQEHWGRFPHAHMWEWVPDASGCNGLREWDQAQVVKELVENGGWLLLGGRFSPHYTNKEANRSAPRLYNGEPLLLTFVPSVPACHCDTQFYGARERVLRSNLATKPPTFPVFPAPPPRFASPNYPTTRIRYVFNSARHLPPRGSIIKSKRS